MDQQASVVRVDLGPRAYSIVIGQSGLDGLSAALESWLNSPADRPAICLVTDSRVWDHHAAGVADRLVARGYTVRPGILHPGEEAKSLACASQLYDVLVDMQADRRTVVVAVGGGVVGDVGGFVAATYARGLRFVQVPTTLLAQVDSSVGGKVGVNHPRGKNLIGAFHQPVGVYADTTVLATLPDREYRSGLAEVVKYGVILDAEFFSYLESHVREVNDRETDCLRHVVARSCRLKANIVEGDEYERTGLRAVLNYGHTLGHALESQLGYGRLLHGEAVAIGMIFASRLAESLGMITADVTQRQVQLLQAFGLPVSLPESSGLTASALLDAMRLDKKAVGGRLTFILPTRLGAVRSVADATDATVWRELERFLAN